MKKLICLITALSMFIPMLSVSVMAEEYDEGETEIELFSNDDEGVELFADSDAYVCDFKGLVKNNADTTYGNASDIIKIDDYTTAYLTYEGTYIKADGTVYLNGSGGAKDAYSNGSYIEFIAPYDGTVSFVIDYADYFIDGKYSGYSSASLEFTEGQKLQLGQRANNRSCVKSLTFTAKPEATPTPEPSDIEEYTSPSTTWDFNSSAPALTGKKVPVISGNAEWKSGEVQFPADTTDTGALSVDMENAVKGCVNVEFDIIGHDKALGQQYFHLVISNSEEEIVNLEHHGYDDNYGKGVYVCGEKIAENADIRTSISSNGTTHIKASVDYTAGKVTLMLGSKIITGDIPEGTVADIKSMEISSTRSKTAASRYISVDNLKIEEFTSQETPTTPTVTEGYSQTEIAGYPCQVKAQNGKTVVIYLASELRSGSDGYSQLYDAIYIFDKLDGDATLIAPQTATEFSDITALVAAVKTQYSASSVTVIGQSKSANAALLSGADRIITIAGSGNATPTTSQVWAFAGYNDNITRVSDVKTMVNRLQKAKISTRYTEYPYEAHKIGEKVAEELGLADWILEGADDTKTVDLVLFSGQSNMAGRGDYQDATPLAAGKGYEYHAVTEPGVLSSVTEPFGKYENNTNINDAGSNGIDRRSGDMVTSLMSAYYDKTGVPMVGVQATRGGTNTGYWKTAAQYNEAINRYKEAEEYLVSAGYTVRKKMLVWCQGEGDADNTNFSADGYKSNTLSIFNTFKSGTGITDVFIVQTGHYNINHGLKDGEEPTETALASDARYKAASKAQKEIAAENENIYAVASFYTAESLSKMRDQYHYYQPVYNKVGKTAGENIAAALAGESYTYPDESVEEAIASVNLNSFVMEIGETMRVSVGSVLNTDGRDLKNEAVISDYQIADTSVAQVNADGAITAKKNGETTITYTVSVERLNYSKSFTSNITVSIFSVTSSDAQIDVSAIRNYGADTYRVYHGKGYTDVKAADGKVTNPYSGEVTVVPVYRFNYTNAAIDGYTTATGEYSASIGYGALSGINYSVNENGSYPISGRPLHVDIPAGSYDINVLRKGGARADVYNDGVQIINNTTSYGSDNRPSGSGLMYAPQIAITDGSMDLTFGGTSGSNERIATVELVRVPDKYRKSIVWVAGDSESANYYPINENGDDLTSNKKFMTGFGMQLPKYLSTDDYKVANWGQPSATTKTWSDECLESVKNRMVKGDTIIICFGINDAVNSTHKVSIEQMKLDMAEIIAAAKEKEVQPILVSPVYNNKYDRDTFFKYDGTTNAMYAFAKEQGIPCIDLNKGMRAYKDKAIADTNDSTWVTNNYHVADNLHLTQHTACMAAAIIAGGMKELGYNTTDFAVTYKDHGAPKINPDNTSYSLYGEETGVSRVYSIAALAEYITVEGETTENPPNPPVDNKLPVTLTYDETANTVTAVSEDSDIKSAVLINAVYENGIMKSVNMYDMNFENGKATKEFPVEKGAVLYLWDNVNTMKPLAEKYEYKGEGTITPSPSPSAQPTILPTTNPTAQPTDEPREILYSQNFEGYEVGTVGGWTQSAGNLAIRNDTSVNGMGKYLAKYSEKSGFCRSGYVEIPEVKDNFVFECDYKSESNANVSDLELLENKGSIYANHGVYSNQNFVFTMARPKNSDLYVINNKFDDSGFTVENYDDPTFKTAQIADNPWIHIKVIGDFDAQTVNVKITSLDGKTEYYHGVHDMNVGRDKKITSWKCIHILSATNNADTCIDNIVVSKANASDLSKNYHKVTIKCKNYSFDQYVLDGKNVVNIPDISLYGDSFEGWTIGDDTAKLTSEQLAKVPVTSDCVIVGNVNESYIEALSSVEFNLFPAGNELVMGEDENTYGDNEISLTITGEQGTSLVTAPDSRVTDYKIEWSFDGFRILDGAPTGETGSVYCDSYGLVEITEPAQSKVNFKLKKTSANYYGMVTATVTYNGKTETVSKPLILLGDKNNSDIFPPSGYTSSYNKYDSELKGYEFTTSNPLFGGAWEIAGSDGSRVTFETDNGGNFLRYSRNGSGNSAYGNLNIGNITGQTIFEQDLRFNGGGSIHYSGGGSTSESDTAFALTFDGSKLSFNGTKVCDAAKGTWYHVVICADPTSKLTWAKVYDTNGTLLGESQTVAFANANYKSGAYYRIYPDKSSNNSIDFNNLKIYTAETDSITVTPSSQTAAIPESGTTTVNLTAAATTTNGDSAIGLAKWSIDDEFAEGVSIASNGNQSAVLTVTNAASAGDLPIRCTIGSKSTVVTVKLTGTKNNIAFTTAKTGILIENETKQYPFAAELRNGNAEKINGDISYALYDETNTNPITPTGVSIDALTGILTVTSAAQPQTIGIRATSGDISKFIKAVIYNLNFSFNASMNGYTQVGANTYYSDSRGYGFEGDTFKVKLESGKVYNVSADYAGTIVCEKIDSSLSGFETTSKNYDVAIFGDGIMDITPKSGAVLNSVNITEVKKTAGAKPQWWTIGDSTVQQSDSWGYTIAATSTTDLSKYPALASVCSAFYNSGKAGEQHKNFYSNGRLNYILTQMKPGDIVSLCAMGTNDSSGTKEQFKAYDKAYVDAIIDMGGYVILGSYTPTGNYGATKGKVYDPDNMTFKGMRTNAYDLAIRELYEEYKDNDHVLGFVDIGKFSDEMMTADVKSVYDAAIADGKTENEARAAANAKADEMMAWWKDYNHYYTEFSNYILPTLTDKVAELITTIN